MINIFSKSVFLTSAAILSQLPQDDGIEIAFAGRSNAGKSSAINAITSVHNLAKTSKTPGRTQTINLFQIDANRRLVDLPGYGFAKVPPKIKQQWEETLSRYLQIRASLRGLCLVMDIRHPLQIFDQHMIAWADKALLPVHILLSKADKLSRSNAINILHKTQQKLIDYPTCTCQIFSAVSGEGIMAARKQLYNWLAE
jgi:GTP-binding protein